MAVSALGAGALPCLAPLSSRRPAPFCSSRSPAAFYLVRLARQAPRPCAAVASDQEVAPGTTAAGFPTNWLHPLDDSYARDHSFTAYANWLLPGALLLGRYPYVEPSRCYSRKQGEDQMEAIMDMGITTFVSLQAETPPQAEMEVKGTHGFLPYKATAELIHSSNGPPPPQEIMSGLRNPTLDKFLPPRHKPASDSYRAFGERRGLEFVHSPILDLSVPNMEQLHNLVQDLQERLLNGQRLYVHCWGGRGRAGTVGSCLLASMYGISADEALERVQSAYDTRRDMEKGKSPETEEQIALVRSYVKTLAKA